MAIPATTLAWMAGIFDLKALVITKHNNRRATPQLVLSVQSTNLGVIDRLSQLTGTAPEARERRIKDWMRKGCTEHCPEAHVHSFMQGTEMPMAATWRLTGAGAAVVLCSIIPYMLPEDARGMNAMLEEIMANLVVRGQGVGMVRASVRRLADLGWEIPPEMQHLLGVAA